MADKIDLDKFNLDEIQDAAHGAAEAVATLREDQKALREEVVKHRDGLITEADLNERMDKINNSMDALETKIKEAANAQTVLDERPLYHDYRAMLTGIDYMTHENGEPFTEIDYEAQAVFYTPVDYKELQHGQRLQNLRNLHDAVLMIDAMKSFDNNRNYHISKLPIYKELIRLTEVFSPKLAHAMATGNTGFGSEWVPQEMSAQFNEILRLTPSLPSRFEFWNMPRGSSGYYPFQNGTANVYKGGEATGDIGDQARKTNIATDRHLFTPTVFIGALVTSEEMIEDAIMEMVGFIRRELATALLEHLESAIINGDTGTHIDNAAETYWQTYDVETSFIGLRARADDDSKTADAESFGSDTGVGALTVDAFIGGAQMMDLLGAKSKECFWLTGVKGKGEVQKALYKEDALGILAYIISGELPTIDGSPFEISGQYLEDQETDGFGDNVGDEKHTSICRVHPKSWRIAQRRGVKLQMAEDIETQQRKFVASARWDLGTVSASSVYPVSCLINVQHTA